MTLVCDVRLGRPDVTGQTFRLNTGRIVGEGAYGWRVGQLSLAVEVGCGIVGEGGVPVTV